MEQSIKWITKKQKEYVKAKAMMDSEDEEGYELNDQYFEQFT